MSVWRKTQFDRYWISSEGKCIGPRYGKEYAHRAGSLCNGYRKVFINGKLVSIHSMVLEAFVGQRPQGFVANHKNANKTDNRVENLEWISSIDNVRHAILMGLVGNRHRKLTAEQVREIRKLHRPKTHNCLAVLSKKFGVSRDSILQVVKRRSYKHIP